MNRVVLAIAFYLSQLPPTLHTLFIMKLAPFLIPFIATTVTASLVGEALSWAGQLVGGGRANPFTDFRLVKAEAKRNHERYKCKNEGSVYTMLLQCRYSVIVVHKPAR